MNTYYKIKENIKALEVVKAAPFVLKKRNEDIIIHHKDDNKN